MVRGSTFTAGLALSMMIELKLIFSMVRTYRRGDKERPCRTPRLGEKGSGTASFPDVSLAAKGVSVQGMKGRGQDGRRLADFVFKMAECSMADDYAIFKKELRPVCFTNFEGKVVFPHPVCQEEAVFLQLNGLQHHYRIRQ